MGRMTISGRSHANVYDLFAPVYARVFGAQSSAALLPLLEKTILSELPAGARVLDVCCGPAYIARELTARGLRVTGIDNSPALLAYARQIAPHADLILADARSFDVGTGFDAALCNYNSLCHFTCEDELAQVFSSVRRALRRGGRFLFDVYMEPAYRRRWRGSYTVDADGFHCVVHPSYDAERSQAHNLIKLRWADGEAEFDLVQHCHPEEAIRSALDAAGLGLLQTFDAGRDWHIPRETGRWFFLCERPQTKSPAAAEL